VKQPLTRKEKSERFALVLWALTPICELPGVGIAIATPPKDALAVAFGSVGVQVLLCLGAVLAVAGLVVGRSRSATMGARKVLVMLLFIEAGILDAMMFVCLNDGGSGGQFILLMHSMVAIVAIASMLLRQLTSAQPSQLGS